MHSTFNPVPSNDPCDGEDNLKVLDNFLQTDDDYYLDRLDQRHLSRKGAVNVVLSSISEAANLASEAATGQAKQYADQAGVYASDAHDSASQATAAAGAIGPIKFFGNYSQAVSGIAGLVNGDLVEVAVDETRDWARTRYRVQSGGLSFVVNLDQLRIDLKSDSRGSSLVTYSSGIPNSLNFSVKKALDETVDLKTKFGLTGDIDADQTAAFNDLISYINSLSSGGGSALIKGCYRISGAIQEIKKSIRLVGEGVSRSRLFFDNSNGLIINLSSISQASIGVNLSDFAITTNANNKVGLKFLGNISGSNGGAKIIGSNIFMSSERRYNGLSSSSEEWLNSIVLGDPAIGGRNASEAKFDDLWIYGSDNNGTYAGLTSSNGIITYGVSALHLVRPKIFLVGDDGIKLNGGSAGTENLIVDSGTIVGGKRGLALLSPANPSNNHIITNTHFSPYLKGIYSEPTTGGYSAVPLANFISKCFILERESTTLKPSFIGVDVAWKNSVIESTSVWANPLYTASPTVEKIGFRVAKASNIIRSCISKNMRYAYEEFSHPGIPTNNINFVEILREDALSFTSPNSLPFHGEDIINARGTKFMSHTALEISHPNTNSFWVQEYPGTRKNMYPGNTFYHWDIKTSSGASSYDARLYVTGGTEVTGNGGWVFYGATIKCKAAFLSGADDNATDCGMPSLRWKAVYAATGSINTSDARLKTEVNEFSSAELKCAKQIAAHIGNYKWIKSIEEKGESDARKHFGITVQKVIEIFELNGLDAFEYGAVCYDSWEAQDELSITHEDGTIEVTQEAREAGDIYSLRWEELGAFLSASLSSAIDSLESRIEAIENRLFNNVDS